jgi:mRNA interferase RelE/StbE
MIAAIRDRRVREGIRRRMDSLAEEPDKQGQPLSGELVGLRSIRAVGQRYRIIYRLEEERVIVMIVAVGIRREGGKSDIYELARRLVRLRLVDRD